MPDVHSDGRDDRGRRYTWTQPQCANCFQRDNPERTPHRLKVPETERCVTCGVWTQDGIYIRIDPREAPYPSLLKEADALGRGTEDY